MTKKRVLIIEDDPDSRAMLEEILTVDGFTVDAAATGIDGESFLDVSSYDLLILDWELPDTSGVDLLKRFRQKGVGAPSLMLTARSHIDDKEKGFEHGADDYLTKPFNVRELRARINALLRRGHYVEDVLAFKNVMLNIKTHEVFVDDERVTLLPKEYALLEALLRNRNQIFTLDSLINTLWDASENATYDAVRTCMTRLRKKIDRKERQSIITTVVGVGYKIEDREG